MQAQASTVVAIAYLFILPFFYLVFFYFFIKKNKFGELQATLSAAKLRDASSQATDAFLANCVA